MSSNVQKVKATTSVSALQSTSEMKWFGSLPEAWKAKRLKYVFKVQNGATPKSGVEEYWDGDIPWVTPDDLGSLDGIYIKETFRRITVSGYESCGTVTVPAGSIILSTRAPIGNLGVATGDLCTNQGCRGLAFRSTEVVKHYFYFLFESARDELRSLGQGSTFTELSKTKLESVFLPVPPVPNQRAIADFLDRKTALIDDVIAKKQKLIELLKEKRQALITQAVTKGLDPNAKLRPSGIEWLGDIPEGWEVKRLKRLGRPIIGLTYSPEDVTMADHGTLVLRASNVQAGRIVYEDNVYVSVNIPKELQTRVGDILICSRSGSANLIGKNAIIDNQSAGMTFGAFMTIFRSAHNAFLYFFFNSPLFESQSGLYATTTINQLTTSMLSNFMLAVPPVREQGRIVDFLIRETSQIDSVVTKIIDQIDKLHEYRLALITSAVTGNIDVRGQ